MPLHRQSRNSLSQVRWFAIEYQKKSEIALGFLYYALCLVSKPRAKLRLNHERFPAVGAVNLLAIFIVSLYFVQWFGFAIVIPLILVLQLAINH